MFSWRWFIGYFLVPPYVMPASPIGHCRETAGQYSEGEHGGHALSKEVGIQEIVGR